MPVVDYEAGWFALKAHIASKRSHGADDLQVRMAQIEVDHRLPESQQGFDDRPAPQRANGRQSRPAHVEPIQSGS